MLMENGATWDVKDAEGRTPFHCACEEAENHGSQSVILVLVREVEKAAQKMLKPTDNVDRDTVVVPTMSPDPMDRRSVSTAGNRRRADSEFCAEAPSGGNERTMSQASRVSWKSAATDNRQRRMTWHPNDNKLETCDENMSIDAWISSRK
jgi:hypothetical protein